MRWEFTGDEFLYAWGESGSDRIPAPLTVTPSVRWRHEWDALVADLRERLPAARDPDLSAVLRLAAAPDMAITVIGTREDKPLRLYCASTQQSAVALAQPPAEDCTVVVRTGIPTSVPAWIARFAGDRRAGAAPPLTESVHALTTPAQAVALDYGELSTADRVHDLLSAPRSGYGHVEVVRGRPGSSDGPARRFLSWFDVVDDGRYVYRYRHGDLMIEPCSSARFEKLMARMLGIR
ncbi:ESX secretion-associated protein EspG [Nocardia sp. AG03]|uniref:ESX secretion-associated protein EspG n=1 Tax=Nocardia sp. AG03 TaxID=3025312 RepID=UPI0024188014|nr:ESX secretion-associated protein EspG [Nocardia sp. AG03]